MNQTIARCIYEELLQIFPDYHIREELNNPLGPHLTLGLDCELPGTPVIEFFLPIVDIMFGHGQVNLARILPDRPMGILGIEYCDPRMMDLLQEAINFSLQAALEQMTERAKARSMITAAG